MHIYYLLLGSNLGDKNQNIDRALQMIKEGIGPILDQSSRYLTQPWGVEDQEDFINMAVKVNSDKKPSEVLDTIKKIEEKVGRTETIHWGPRILDIDILYCDDKVIDTEAIKIPHPQIYNRNFVLVPLIEIAGEMIDPVKNISLDEIYERCTDMCEVYIFEDESEEELN